MNSDHLLHLISRPKREGLEWRCRKLGFHIFRERERESHFSLELWPIEPSVFDGVRSKVVLRGKGNTWAPVSWSFDKLHEVGVLSYLF